MKRTVKWTLKQMMEAGRITSQGGLYKLSGFPQQIVEDSKRWADEEVGSQCKFMHGDKSSRTSNVSPPMSGLPSSWALLQAILSGAVRH